MTYYIYTTMKLFPAKISERATLQKSMTSKGKSALFPANVGQRPPLQLGLYNEFLASKFPRPAKQNKLFPSGTVIKWLLAKT